MKARRRIVVRGVVQGVSFRPFVHGLARRLGLVGGVRNDAAGVTIDVEGAPGSLDRFERALVAEAPPLAVIHGLDARAEPPRDGSTSPSPRAPAPGTPPSSRRPAWRPARRAWRSWTPRPIAAPGTRS
jgi:hydrogenase maturation protein HypF